MGLMMIASLSITLADPNSEEPRISLHAFSKEFQIKKISSSDITIKQVEPTRFQSPGNQESSFMMNTQITTNENDDFNPSIAIDEQNNPILLYASQVNTVTENYDILLRKSQNKGSSWPENLVYRWETETLSEIYPKISVMETGNKAYGTHQIQGGGSYLYLHEYNDLSDPDSWEMSHFDLTPEITNVQDTAITTYGGQTIALGGVVDLNYHEYRLQNTMVLFWTGNNSDEQWPGLFVINEDEDVEGSSFPISDLTADSGEDLLVAFKLVENMNQYLYVASCPANDTIFENWELSYITVGRGNVTNPYLDATNGINYIVFEEERFGNKDIVCYTSVSGSFWRRSVIANSEVDECNPVISASGKCAVCVFSKQGNIYEARSDDGGISWSDSEIVNYYDASVNNEKGSVDIEQFYTVWTDKRNGNDDLFMTEVGALPILKMNDIKGGGSIQSSVTNVGNAVEKQIDWSIEIDGPAIPEKKTGVIQTLQPGEKEIVQMKTVFGFGSIRITVSIGEFSKSVDAFALGSLIIIS